ncbi:MAG: hypothetical protein IH974_08095 [Myxococcales bacterium]|nr:hypothetical protein [Myxococcales bacterium]
MKIDRIATVLALSLLLGLPACTHNVTFHPVQPPAENIRQTDESVKLYMRPELVEASHSFRSALSGIANKWVVDYGARAHEFAVQYLSAAFTDFEEVAEPGTGADANLEIEHLYYTVSGHAAHVTMDVTANDATGSELMSEHYQTRGWRGTGVVLLTGAFGQKGVIRSSTDQAFKEIFLKIIDDLRAAMGTDGEAPEPAD